MITHAIYISLEIWRLPLPTDYRVVLAQIKYYEELGVPETLSNDRLAGELQCSKYKVGKILKDLEENGYIKRQTKIADPALWSKEKTTSVRIMRVTI